MKIYRSLLFFLLTISSFSLFSNDNYFLQDPCISPNGDYIVFSYEGDLWKVSSDGGIATRVTAMDGDETRPNISPDGKWIAFSSTQYGNKDVYIVPSSGGEIKRITYHQSFDDVDSWSWDSKYVYFSSNRYNRTAGYKVHIDGTTPIRLFDHYFNTTHNICEHPKTNDIFFNESWESKVFAHRKRYKGAYNPDIKSYNPKTKKYTKHTDYNGKDFAVTIDKKGNVYFQSDQNSREYNLFSLNNGKIKQLTKFNESIYWPKVSANGKKIVFRKDYQIFIYDVDSGKSKVVPVELFKHNTLAAKEDFRVQGNIQYFDVSPDGKKMCFTSRGRLFVSDIKGKFIKQIQTKNQEAVAECVWLKDNKTILFTETIKGYYNLYTRDVSKDTSAVKLTGDSQNNRAISLNEDRTEAVYLSGRNEVRLLDLETLVSEKIATEELWGLYNSKPYFSPDDNYILFTAYRDFELDLFLYNKQEKQLINLSQTRISESDPYWSPDGKYIYFSSDRMKPTYPFGTRDANIYRIALDKIAPVFRSDKLEELFKEEKKEVKKEDSEKGEKENDEKKEDKSDEKDEKDEKDKSKEKEDKKEAIKLNVEDIMERIELIGPSFGVQTNPYVIQKNGKTTVLYLSNHDEGRRHLWKTTSEDFEKTATEKVSKSPMFSYTIVASKGKYYLLTAGNIHTFNPASSKLDKIEISHTFSKSRTDEFNQIFYETWAGVEENFYDESFHGEDWLALRNEYAKLLPKISNRAALRQILNEMLGELNTSHFGFYTSGKDESTYLGFQTAATGIVFNNQNPYVVERIVKDGPCDILDMDLQKGDLLISVNGVNVDPQENRNKYFHFDSRPRELVLEFKRGEKTNKIKIISSSFGAISSLIYDEWQDANQAYVDSKTKNRVAYSHMKNMGRGEFNQFMLDMTKEGGYKDALILDLRYNTGGNVHDDVLRFLSQRTYLQWKYREGAMANQSNFGMADKPIVLLINEQSLSDAEMTAGGFKQLGLGTIVGMETYRWIIFTSGKGLVDGSFYRLPSWGCYTLDGQNLEKTGVAPDILVEKNFDDRLNGNHPQLDKAIEIIMGELKNK